MAISGRIRAMIEDVSSQRELNYTTHISPELGFIYFATPAAGCSTLKATLNRATARALGLPQPPAEFAAIHARDANPLKRPRDIGMARFEAMLDDPAVTKFAFVRDPAARLRSAFAKKLRRPSSFTRKVRAYLGQEGAAPPPFPDARTFARAVAADPGLLALDEHWRPQRKQIFFDRIPDLWVGLLEEFDQDAAQVLDRLFGAGEWEVVDAVGLNPGNSADRRGAPALDVAVLAAVRSAYAADYAMIEAVRDRRAPATTAAPVTTAATVMQGKPRLILHIGMGKTGTSSIQASLAQAGRDGSLARQRASYLGMWFARGDGDSEATGWERSGAFLRQPPEELSRFGAAWGDGLAAQGSIADTFLLSNESLIGAAPAVAAILAPLRARFSIRAICYLRDPALWLPSAYAQWGIRDRPAGGEPEDLAHGIRRVVRHYRGVVKWLDLMPEILELRPYDGVADIVGDFAHAVGLSLPQLKQRVWTSPEPAEQIARARYSAGFPDRIAADRFDREVLANGRAVPSIEALIARHLDPAAVDAVIAENAAIFDRIAAERGIELRGAAGHRLAPPDSGLIRARLLDYLLEVVLDQNRRIEVLEARLAKNGKTEGPR